MGMTTCEHCEQGIASNVLNCPHCGGYQTALAEEMGLTTCGRCGQGIATDAERCPHCGGSQGEQVGCLGCLFMLVLGASAPFIAWLVFWALLKLLH